MSTSSSMGAFATKGGNSGSIDNDNSGSTEDWGDALATKTAAADDPGGEDKPP